MSDYIIGIDPGTSTGFAVYDTIEEKLIALETTTFWGVLNLLEETWGEETVLIVIEVPESKHVWHNGGTAKGSVQRTALNVGSVIREAELLAEGLERAGYDVKRVNPRGKVKAGDFNKVTGWEGKTNQHVRDAGLLAYSAGRRLASDA